MGLFGGGGSKLPKWAVPAVQQGLSTAQNVFNQNQGNLTELSGMASDAFKQAAPGAFGENAFIDHSKAAAGTISNGFFLGSNPGQGTYNRMQRSGAQGFGGTGGGLLAGGRMPGEDFIRPENAPPIMAPTGGPAIAAGAQAMLSGMRPIQPVGQSSGQSMGGDPSMGLLSHFATSPNSSAANPADSFSSAVASGKYLNHQPSAGMYNEMMDRDYSTSNPFLDDIIRQNDENVTTQANRMFGSRGMGAGISSAYADVLSKNLADTGGQIRYQNYSDAENRRLQAGGQSDAAFGAERGRMGEATGLLGSNFNAAEDRNLAANAQRLSAAQSLGGQYGAGQDRALEAAKAGDAAQSNQVQQMLQALGLTGQIEDAGYAGYAPTTDLLKTAATLPYLGLDAYQSALSNLAGASKVTKGPGLGASILGGAASGAGGALAGLAVSDRRLKKNIEQIGELPDGLGVYEFDYLWDGPRQRGVMADEVATLRPWALGPVIGGEYATVDYGAL